jgi:polyhydroxybutyrate depolymerase
MRRVAGLVAAVVVVLGIAGFGVLHAVDAHGKQVVAGSARIVKVATSTKTYSMTVAGLKRSYQVIAPVGGPPKSAPVIVMLSGYGATVSSEITRDELVPYASTDQAELVYPVAVQTSWNAIGCCGYASAHNVNDVAFIKALVAAVDPGHARDIYVAGYSNGARLAYQFACTDPGLFDAYAAVKGGPMPDCVVRKPVTIAQLASLDDPEAAYKPGDGGRDPIPVTTQVARLHATDQCTAKPNVTHSGTMTLDTWSGCADGTRLALATWTDGKHSFPRPPASVPAAAQVIWSFFTNTPLAALP